MDNCQPHGLRTLRLALMLIRASLFICSFQAKQSSRGLRPEGSPRRASACYRCAGKAGRNSRSLILRSLRFVSHTGCAEIPRRLGMTFRYRTFTRVRQYLTLLIGTSHSLLSFAEITTWSLRTSFNTPDTPAELNSPPSSTSCIGISASSRIRAINVRGSR